MKIITAMIGLVLTGFLGVESISAQGLGSCQPGTLVGMDTRSQTIEGMRNEHYEEKEKKNGKKFVDGYTYGGDRIEVTYVLTVAVGDMIYTAEHPKTLFFGYNPTDMVVNDPVSVCVQKGNLIFLRQSGKEYKTKIVRVERNPERGIEANNSSSDVGTADAKVVSRPPENQMASVKIASTPAGADIEVDGVFVGSTPSQLNLNHGDHNISIRKSGFSEWRRKVRISDGEINLSADLGN